MIVMIQNSRSRKLNPVWNEQVAKDHCPLVIVEFKASKLVAILLQGMLVSRDWGELWGCSPNKFNAVVRNVSGSNTGSSMTLPSFIGWDEQILYLSVGKNL
jgi:hypothetical protein